MHARMHAKKHARPRTHTHTVEHVQYVHRRFVYVYIWLFVFVSISKHIIVAICPSFKPNLLRYVSLRPTCLECFRVLILGRVGEVLLRAEYGVLSG